MSQLKGLNSPHPHPVLESVALPSVAEIKEWPEIHARNPDNHFQTIPLWPCEVHLGPTEVPNEEPHYIDIDWDRRDDLLPRLRDWITKVKAA